MQCRAAILPLGLGTRFYKEHLDFNNLTVLRWSLTFVYFVLYMFIAHLSY